MTPSSRILPLGAILVLVTATLLRSQDRNPVELGTVKWGRDFEAAQRLARSGTKPLLVLFQEVPG